MVSLSLSPLAGFLHRREPGEPERCGLYHRLTGFAVEVTPLLGELLKRSRPAGLVELELSHRVGSTDVAQALDVLCSHHLLVPATSPSAVLRPFLDHSILKPVRNPAVCFRAPTGQPRLVRLDETGVCRLPRGVRAPRVVEEPLPESAARFLSRGSEAISLVEWISQDGGAGSASPDLDAAWPLIDALTRLERQLIRVAPPGSDLLHPGAPFNDLNQSFEPVEDSGRVECGDPHSGRWHYERAIGDADWNFDWVEPTVSHAFRFPSEALGGSNYAERFCDAVLDSWLPSEMGRPTVEVLEIGGGTGEFAAGFIRRARERLGPTREMRYTLLDCSETLLERQRRRLDGADCVLTMVKGDAEELSLSGRRFDIVLANEVIADFRVAPGRPGVNSLTHIGVSAFLRRLAGHLASGGMAFLTEYGELDRPPTRVEHLGHPEYSIRFGEVLETARSLGFHAVATWLPGFLHFRDEASMLVGQQEHILCLNHLIGRDAEPLPYAAWGRGAILGRLAAEIEDRSLSGLAFAPLAYGLQYGPDPRQFHVVSLAFGGAPERAS